MKKKYESGIFCKDIKCERHGVLEGYTGAAYLKKKAVHCKECSAWQFFTWLKDRDYRIVLTVPEISSKELAARLKGIDPVKVKDLTEDEILCL
ncbi:MAG: hypothetical protein PHY31_06880 [Smithellaceae bacterium]|nr:hypothetical protein [Smithellaceae bacterium]